MPNDLKSVANIFTAMFSNGSTFSTTNLKLDPLNTDFIF